MGLQSGSKGICRQIAARTGKSMRAHLETGFGSSVDRLAERTLRVGSLGAGRSVILWFGLIVVSMLAADGFILWQMHKVQAETLRLTGIQEKLNAIRSEE